MEIHYTYCRLDKKDCKPGSRKECKHLTSGVLCPYLESRKEGENVDCFVGNLWRAIETYA